MRGYRTEITRAEFDNACRSFRENTRPTSGSTGTSPTSGSTGGWNPRTIGILDITNPIIDDGVSNLDPTRINRIR